MYFFQCTTVRLSSMHDVCTIVHTSLRIICTRPYTVAHRVVIVPCYNCIEKVDTAVPHYSSVAATHTHKHAQKSVVCDMCTLRKQPHLYIAATRTNTHDVRVYVAAIRTCWTCHVHRVKTCHKTGGRHGRVCVRCSNTHILIHKS